MQQPNYHYIEQTPNQYCLSRSVTSPFLKELLEYELPNIAKLPHLKTYNGTTDLDNHIDMYEWTMTSLKLDKHFWCMYFHTTLDVNACTWLKTLCPGNIYNFGQLKYLLLTNFMQLRKLKSGFALHDPMRTKRRRNNQGLVCLIHECNPRRSRTQWKADSRSIHMRPPSCPAFLETHGEETSDAGIIERKGGTISMTRRSRGLKTSIP